MARQAEKEEDKEEEGEMKLRPTTPMKKPHTPLTPGKNGPFDVTMTTGEIASQRHQTTPDEASRVET